MVKIDFYSAGPAKKEEQKDTRSWWERTKQASIEQAKRDQDKNPFVESSKQIFKAVATPVIKAGTYGQNILSTGEDILGGRYFGDKIPSMLESAEKRRQATKEQEKKAFNLFDFTDTEQNIASTTTDIASSLAVGGGTAKLATKAIPQLGGLFTMPKSVLGGIGQGAVTGGASEVPYRVLSEGRLPTAGEIATSATVGGVTLGVLGTIPKIQKYSNAINFGGIEGLTKSISRDISKIDKKIVPKNILPKAEELLITQLEKTNRMNPTKYNEFEQMAGERAGKFLADRKITSDAETNVANLYKNFEKSKEEADKGLSAIQKTYKLGEVPPAMDEMMLELKKRFSYTKDTEGLDKINKAIGKLEQGTLSHSDINDIKRIYEKKVKVNYIKDQNSLEVERATNIDNAVRNWQFDEADKLGFKNLRNINKETQLNRFLADNIGDKIARQAGLNNISITDWIIAGQIPGTPQALALLAGKKLAQNVVPKIYQKALEKIVNKPKKAQEVANLSNIGKIENIRQSLKPKYDPNRLLVSPRSSSRSPSLIIPEVKLPKGEVGKPTIKSQKINSDITSRSKIVRPGTNK